MGRSIKENDPIFEMKLNNVEDICWEKYDTTNQKTMRETRPVKRGDIIKFKDSRTNTIKRGIVWYAGAHFLERTESWCSWYKVIPETKSGKWSRLWVMIYDGMIERAYE